MNQVVSQVIAEGRALTRSLDVIEAGASAREARRCCAEYLTLHHEPDNLENVVIDGALRKICGLEGTTYDTAEFEIPQTLEGRLLQDGIVRWMQWACDVSIHLTPSTSTHRVSELDRMALSPWLEGIEQLHTGNTSEARRFFRRAVTLGGSYGTRSNPVIQWTYAASFFPTS